jgi:hypothetical protein
VKKFLFLLSRHQVKSRLEPELIAKRANADFKKAPISSTASGRARDCRTAIRPGENGGIEHLRPPEGGERYAVLRVVDEFTAFFREAASAREDVMKFAT